jgi:UDP-glucose:glycoprotein glucosyltransferase
MPCIQIVGPIAPAEFTAEDYQTLQDYELIKRVQPVLNAFEDVVPGLASKDR